MTSTPSQFRDRTKRLALAVIGLVRKLPRAAPERVMGVQLLSSATSVGANYRAACRARSKREFLAKMGVVEEEADETLYWLELLRDAGLTDPALLTPLMREAGEIVAMTVASIKTASRTPPRSPPTTQSAIRNPQSAIRNPQ